MFEKENADRERCPSCRHAPQNAANDTSFTGEVAAGGVDNTSSTAKRHPSISSSQLML